MESITVRFVALRLPWFEVLRLPPLPSDFSMEEPSMMVERAVLCRYAVALPTGRIGPRHPLTPWYCDPYFTSWRGFVAWDAVARVLYIDNHDPRRVSPYPTDEQAAEIVACIERADIV